MNLKKIAAAAMATALCMAMLAVPASAADIVYYVELRGVYCEGFTPFLEEAEASADEFDGVIDWGVDRYERFDFKTGILAGLSPAETWGDQIAKMKGYVISVFEGCAGFNPDYITVTPANIADVPGAEHFQRELAPMAAALSDDIAPQEEITEGVYYHGYITVRYAAPTAAPAATQNIKGFRESIAPYYNSLDVDVACACVEYNATHGTNYTYQEYWDLIGYRVFAGRTGTLDTAAAPAAPAVAPAKTPALTAEQQTAANAAIAAEAARVAAEAAQREADFAAAVAAAK